MLNDVLAGLEDPQSHLNLKDQVVDRVEDANARPCVCIPMFPLNGQQALEVVEDDRGLI